MCFMDTSDIHALTKCVGAVLMFEYRNAVEYVMESDFYTWRTDTNRLLNFVL